MRERHWKTWELKNSQIRLSRAIFTSACFWSTVLRWDASLMAVLIFFKSEDKLNFWTANPKGTEDGEGLCFHRKYECSAMMAVAEQQSSSYDRVVRNESTHQYIERQYPQRLWCCQSRRNFVVVRILNGIDTVRIHKRPVSIIEDILHLKMVISSVNANKLPFFKNEIGRKIKLLTDF